MGPTLSHLYLQYALDFDAISLKIWKLGGRHGLVAHKIIIHGWGVSQLQRAYDKMKVPPFVDVGT